MTSQTTPSSAFSAEVRAQLARQRKSARALAEEIGISHATLYRRLNDESPWPFDDVMAVCLYLEVSLRSMVGSEVSA
jgi:DNA-binding phage protein